MKLALTNPIDYERTVRENGVGKFRFAVTISDDTGSIIVSIPIEVVNTNDHDPVFVDQYGDPITRLDIYFNGIGKHILVVGRRSSVKVLNI